jgi:hypothetical protein
MSTSKRRGWLAAPLAIVVVAACAGAAPPEVVPEATPGPAVASPGAQSAGADAGPQETASATADGGSDAAPAAPSSADSDLEKGPKSCPADMKLVEGSYCTEVEHKCKKEWFDKSNKKRICEEFEPTAKCVGQRVKKRYCIDTYEWPNQKGVRPEVMNRFHQAQVKCAAVGKRMCTESEWTFACEGPEMLPFPYGFVRDATKCNGDHMWDEPNMGKVAKRDAAELARLWKGVPSGSQPNCISPFGVADLPANTDEVMASETFTHDFRGKFDSVHSGGPWYKGVRNQCRPKIYTHNEDFYYYFLSFRCCAEPDGKPNEPRTARQVKEGWKMERVEKSAQFSVSAMKEKLELKKAGKCACKGTDILCKTMCGTLLGPNAKDGR